MLMNCSYFRASCSFLKTNWTNTSFANISPVISARKLVAVRIFIEVINSWCVLTVICVWLAGCVLLCLLLQERHFRQAHFLCEDADCLDKKFVVFEDQLALQAHKYSYHTDKSGMSQADRRNASRLNIHFNVAGSASAAFNTPAAPAPAPSAGRNTRTVFVDCAYDCLNSCI
jgi:hypothetical protein